MKKIYFFVMVLFVSLITNCDSFAQQIPVKITYKSPGPASADSLQLVIKKSLNINELTFVDSSDYVPAQFTGLQTYNIPLNATQAEFTANLGPSGEWFQMILVVWKKHPTTNQPTPSKITVSAKYQLPFYVERATIINVEF